MQPRAALLLAGSLLAACNQSGAPARTGAGDCAKVAAVVASFELGPDSSADARAAAIARRHEACTTHAVTAAEAACIQEAKTTWAVIECAPRMFPERASGDDCKAVAARMREAIAADLPADVGSSGAAMVERMIPVVETSCREDNWPEDYRSCVVAAAAGDKAALQPCDGKLPDELRVKLGERLKPIVQGTLDAPVPP